MPTYSPTKKGAIMSYNHLRKGRISLPHHAYNITTVTAGRRLWFADWRIGRLVVAEMRRAHDAGEVKSLAFVVMPDHVHWLLALAGTSVLADVVGAFKGRSARTANRALGREGMLWQTAYYDHALRGDEDMRRAARYIVANPLRAGLVESIGDYPLWDAAWIL